MSGRCLEGLWKVSGRPRLTYLALEFICYCLNVVLIVYGGCLESACKVSGRWMEGVLLAFIGGSLGISEACMVGVWNMSKACL